MNNKKSKSDISCPEDVKLPTLQTNHTLPSKTIYDVPPEILQNIFQKLSGMTGVFELMKIRHVNKSWRDNVDSYLSSQNTVAYKGYLGTRTKSFINYKVFKGLLSKYNLIKSIIIRDCIIGDELGIIMRKMAPDLKLLSLQNCPGLNWKGICNIGLILENITHIKLYYCNLKECHLYVLVTCLRKLQTFRVIDTHSITNGLFLKDFGPDIRDINISLFSTENPNTALEALFMGNGRNIENLGIGVEKINSINLNEIAKNLKNLNFFKMTFVSSHKEGLDGISKMKKLNTLIMVEMALNPNESVINDRTLIKIMTDCKTIKNLQICATCSKVIQVTDQSLIRMSELLPAMETLRIINTPNFGNESLRSFNKLNYLSKFEIQQNLNITNEGIEFISVCPHIRELKLVGCTNVDESVIVIWEKVAEKRKRELIKLNFKSMNFRDVKSEKKNLKINYS